MGMTRLERIALHKKQERMQVKVGEISSNTGPDAKSLKEGVPELRATTDGIVEYVKHNGLVYKKTLDSI